MRLRRAVISAMDSKLFSVVLLLCLVEAVLGAKKLHLSVKDISDCDGFTADHGLTVETNLLEKNSKFLLNSSVALDFVVDENVTYSINVSIWSEPENVWRTLFYINGTLCNGLKMIPKLWNKVATAAKAKETCPIPPGQYELLDFAASAPEADVPLMVMPGRFLVESHVYKDEEMVMCKRLEVEGVA